MPDLTIHVTKRSGSILALNDVTCTAPSARIAGLLGPSARAPTSRTSTSP